MKLHTYLPSLRGPSTDSEESADFACSSTQRRRWLAALATWGSAGAMPWLAGCAATGLGGSATTPSSTHTPTRSPSGAANHSTPPVAVNTDPRTPALVLPEPANPALPSLLLIGDSTVRNGWNDGQGLGPVGQWGWGHVLARYVDPAQVNVVNRAIGGLSSRTYRTAGHWERTRALIRRGDWVLIQFGHNDSSPVNDKRRARGTLRGTGDEQQTIDNLLTGQRETVATYGAYLRQYIADCRAQGAQPVLCTPVPRQRVDAQGRTVRDVARYAGWAAEVARSTGVPLIDLDAQVAQHYDQLGPAVVSQLFPRTQPPERVHTNWAGAALNAQVVLAELKRLALLPPAALGQPFGPTLPAHAPAGPSAGAPPAPDRPMLFIVGDSTVRSGGRDGMWGWGERLAPWLDTAQMPMANHAIGGRSTRTFLREGRWARVRSQLKPGDTVLIQFGHNDGGTVGDPRAKQRGVLPGTGTETQTETLPDGSVEVVHSFGHYLTRYLRDALDAGAVPVVLSPVPHKDRWRDGRDFANFADWAREVCQREGTLFVDLTLRVSARYQALGETAVAALFADERTHTNDAGARLNAACVADALRELPQAWLRPWVVEAGPDGQPLVRPKA